MSEYKDDLTEILIGSIVGLIAVVLTAIPIQYLWNSVIVDLLTIDNISYVQSVGLILFFRLLLPYSNTNK